MSREICSIVFAFFPCFPCFPWLKMYLSVHDFGLFQTTAIRPLCVSSRVYLQCKPKSAATAHTVGGKTFSGRQWSRARQDWDSCRRREPRVATLLEADTESFRIG